jgi:16S rRNA (guanine(966)-N(2))-methyltransferase RsmD
MRIIAGTLRGRRLLAPAGETTRPMLDRVREALFATLLPRLGGARVLDLFAGSGSLGLEALSRGARHVCFVERGAPALACLRDNVAALGVAESCVIVPGDALDARTWGDAPVDVVFFDPPYALLDEPASRRRLLDVVGALAGRHLVPTGILVFHAPRRALAAEEFAPAVTVRERTYGTNALWYVEPAPPA